MRGFIGFIGRDGHIRQLQTAPLDRPEHPRKEALSSSVARAIKLGREIVVIENEFLPQEFKRQGDGKESVGRIVGVDHIESTFDKYIASHQQTRRREIGVFHDVTDEGLYFQE